jgi:hypothetical protein
LNRKGISPVVISDPESVLVMKASMNGSTSFDGFAFPTSGGG